MTNELRQKQDNLVMAIRRSVLYHNYRRKFFDNLNNTASFVGLLFGSCSIYTAFVNVPIHFKILSGVIVSIFAAINLVAKSNEKARIHSELAKKFIELEKQIVTTGVEINEEQYRAWEAARLTIETEEPPIKRVLDIYCHNEIIIAYDRDRRYLVPMSWIQRQIKQFTDYGKDDLVQKFLTQTTEIKGLSPGEKS